ncbi:MAG: fused response regulator/phosphatase [Syntrophobacterales bacterium]|nr:fused response regulator/phosphatase [Syntrophobacterales bacterium]
MILIVDDSKIDRLIIGNILRKEGFSITYAEDGYQAIEVALQNIPDLILLDVIMPGLDGYETLKSLKKEPSLTDIPVIFLSAADKVEDKVKGLSLGGVDYITKPVEVQELLARIKVHLKIREAIERLQVLQKEQLKTLEVAQKAILVKPEDLPEARFAVYYSPLSGAGGDFYDVVEIGNNIYGFFLGDISGHDLKSAFVTSALKVIIRQNFNMVNTLTELFKNIQNTLCPLMPEEMFLSAVAVRINRNTRHVRYITAGHPPALVLRRDGDVQILKTDGDLLCAFPIISLSEEEIFLKAGDRIILYSDGLLEHKKMKYFNIKQAVDLISDRARRLMNLSLDLFVERLVESIVEEKANQDDDITLLAVEL